MGMEPEQEERERAVVLAKEVESAAANRLSAGVRRGCARSWIDPKTRFGAAFVVTRLPVSDR